MIKRCIPFTALILLTGCASITEGSTQIVSVETTPKQGAQCKLENPKGTWVVDSTPGNATVKKARGPLSVNCELKGYGNGSQKVESYTKAMAFGNILLGGGIGAGADMATGAAYEYPAKIEVQLDKVQSDETEPPKKHKSRKIHQFED